MKTNVSIKFNSIEEYREIEKKLIELGYWQDVEYNEYMLYKYPLRDKSYKVDLDDDYEFIIDGVNWYTNYTYNSLEEFLKDE